MNPTEILQLLADSYEHLWHGRHRLALISAQKVYEARPDDYNAALCYAWALLENGDPARALELANLAVELSGNAVNSKLYRGFFLSRMSIFEGALSDLNFSINQQQSHLVWAYLNKAKSLAGLQRYFEALEEIDKAIALDCEDKSGLHIIRRWYKIAADLNEKSSASDKHDKIDFLKEGEEAFKQKEYWFTLYAAKNILDNPRKRKEHKKAMLLELEAMYALFQFKPAIEKAQAIKAFFDGDEKFINIYSSLKKLINKNKTEDAERNIINIQKRIDFCPFQNGFGKFIDIGMFNFLDDQESDERKFLIQFNTNRTRYICAEIIFVNPFYNRNNIVPSGSAAWYLNDIPIGKTNFKLNLSKEWESVSFTQKIGKDEPGFWTKGQARIEIIINDLSTEKINQKVCERWFLIGDKDIIQTIEKKSDTVKYNSPKILPIQQNGKSISQTKNIPADLVPDNNDSLDSLMAHLDSYVGLNNIKQSMRNFISYLQFLNERKKLGLKVETNFSIHCVFQGNPGTGKTSIARLLGKIFKAMGLLEKGHVIEVDRTGLVGQYIGETAIKTEKVINDASGGVLFIDEAYSLVKKSGGDQDFGQEAIDILLKRMEDRSGGFAVVAAGYPDEMKSFLDSNPGLKSRFNNFFDFEDYSPDELLEIFKKVVAKEDYLIHQEGITILQRELTRLYRGRDKSFGNARIANKFFNDVKIQLSQRYLNMSNPQRTKEAMITILPEDIENVISGVEKKHFALNIDEENLTKALDKLNRLTGIDSVKKEINEIVKLVRYYNEQDTSLEDKFFDHFLFLGNPGTGKTTVARIFSEIYSALGILPKGHLVETDRKGLVANYIGQTAALTNEIIDKAIGGTLFIDEAYSLIKNSEKQDDFGHESLDVLLKRMEDDRGKFIVMAAGYTEEMQYFIESNPGLQSRFTKTFLFEDYSPDELMKITINRLYDKDYKLDEKAYEPLKKYYSELYRNRDKNFGNARITRNLVEGAVKNQLLRMVEAQQEEYSNEEKIIRLSDIENIISFSKEKKYVKIEGDPELLNKYMIELSTLIGLGSVKKSVNKLVNSLKVAKLREERGLTVIEKNLHSVFTGNPGTGKTTVARLLSKIYKEMGLLEKGHLIEVDRASLVAGYQGQTAIKTENMIKQALGGTLFIDEAYTLSRGSGDFGQEAIDALLKKMEDYRDKFVVIVAGYPDEMKLFLSSNPGLESRFSNYFTFEDYSPRQMLEICDGISSKSGYKLDEGALQLLLEIFHNLYSKRNKNFGNARTARNIFYECISNQEERISKLYNCSDDDLMTIAIEDVEKITLPE